MAIFTRRTIATEQTVERELDAHILNQVKQEGNLGKMAAHAEGAIYNDVGEWVGSYDGVVNSYGRLVSVSIFSKQGKRS